MIQVYITNAYRAYRLADRYRARGSFVALGGLHVTSLPREAAAHADAIFLGPGEQTFPQFLEDFRAGRPQPRYRVHGGPDARSPAAGPPRPHQAAQLSRPQLHRRHARLSAALRLLLQGRVLCRRPIVLHPARGRRARRDRAAARAAPLLPRRPSARRSPLRARALRRHAWHEPPVPGRGDRRLDPARRSRSSARRMPGCAASSSASRR